MDVTIWAVYVGGWVQEPRLKRWIMGASWSQLLRSLVTLAAWASSLAQQLAEGPETPLS